MTIPRSTPSARRADRRLAFRAVLAGLFLVAAAIAAYGDWILWEPYSGLMITLVAAAILLFAVVLATVPRARQAALVAGVVGVGILAGQNLGPSRPELQHSEGTMTVSLSAPRATTGTGPATCSMDAAATELQVSGGPDLRLDVVPDDPSIPPDVDQREFLGVSLSVGDRWQRRRTPRADTTALLIIVGRVEAESVESRMSADASSSLDIKWSADGGTLRFAGLVPETASQEPTGEFIDLAGSIEWTC